MEKKIEQLLQEKEFRMLTAEEKYYVTESIGEAEYNRMHMVLKQSQAVFQKPPLVPPQLKKRLLSDFKKHHANHKPGVFQRMLLIRIPAWQAAAAIAMLIGIQLCFPTEPNIVEKIDTVYVHSTDTIYKEVALPATVAEAPRTPARINVKPSVPQPVNEEPPVYLAAIDTAARQYEMATLNDTFNMQSYQSKGQSVTQTAELWELLGKVY